MSVCSMLLSNIIFFPGWCGWQVRLEPRSRQRVLCQVANHLLSSSIVQYGLLDYYDYAWDIVVWRMLLNLIPTKDSLIYRGIIPHNSNLCSSGWGQAENVDHLFVGYEFYGSIWIIWKEINNCLFRRKILDKIK